MVGTLTDDTNGNCLAILLAGGQGSRLYELTRMECKPAVHFAGPRRIVDFVMANAAKARLGRMIVATQYRPQTLAQHLDQIWSPSFPKGGLMVRDGLQVAGRQGYRGTADAVAANIAEIDQLAPQHVIILAGDHIYEMDYSAMIRAHCESGAMATVAVNTVPLDEARSFGVFDAAANGRIKSFAEKPQHPVALPDDPDQALISMGIYVFSWPWLRDALMADADHAGSSHDFGSDILPAAVAAGVAQVYRQPLNADGSQPYWRDVGTLDAYRLAQLDFASHTPPCRLPLPPGPALRSATDVLQFGFEISSGGVALRAPRYRAEGLGRWTVLDGSVILPGARLAPGVRLTRTIVGPGTVVPEGLVVGEDPQEDARWFRQTEAGTTLITTAMLARRGADRPIVHSGFRIPMLNARNA